MAFITQGKTNIKYLLIIVFVFLLSVGGIFIYARNTIKEVKMISKSNEIKTPEKISQEKTTSWDLENAEYYSLFLEKTIKLTNGLYEELPPEPGMASHCEAGIYKNKIAVGDLNNDKKEDAVVVLDATCGGSGDFRELAIMINKDGKPSYFASKELGDRVIINSINIQLGIITIDMVVRGPNDGMCCPTLKKVTRYQLSGNQLIEALEDETGEQEVCINSGGKIATSTCCKSTGDFPNLCLIGACGCSPDNSHQVNICDCDEGKCFDGNGCVAIQANVYYITIKRKEGSHETTEWLTTFLAELLNLPFKDYSAPSISITYDTRDGSPYNNELDFSYYIFVADRSIKLKNKYEDENVIVDVTNVDIKLMPYLNNSDYCEKDEDCVIREKKEDGCMYGAFNYYQEERDVWGCEWIYYPEENQESLDKMCDNKTQHPEVKYTGSKCINNQCKAQGKTITCEEGVPT